jgi:hypothetical protein
LAKTVWHDILQSTLKGDDLKKLGPKIELRERRSGGRKVHGLTSGTVKKYAP